MYHLFTKYPDADGSSSSSSEQYDQSRSQYDSQSRPTPTPESDSQAMKRFKDKLSDSDPGVVAATVNVLCELARREPRKYLGLAPKLFHLMTTESNNWMLIKIIKIVRTIPLAFSSYSLRLPELTMDA